VLEITVLRFITNFSLFNCPVFLTILWALGWSMVALGFLSWLPIRLLAIGSILVILLHNLADSITAQSLGAAGPLWNILHQPGVIPLDGIVLIVAYPLVPWIAVMAAGLCFGPVMSLEDRKRRAWMIRLGLGMILMFLALRAINTYGDPVPWSSAISGRTLLSFLRCTKYPPSLDFLLMTLGPALLLLAWFDWLNFSSSGLSEMNPTDQRKRHVSVGYCGQHRRSCHCKQCMTVTATTSCRTRTPGSAVGSRGEYQRSTKKPHSRGRSPAAPRSACL
jgi:uncharacterized membrane protein